MWRWCPPIVWFLSEFYIFATPRVGWCPAKPAVAEEIHGGAVEHHSRRNVLYKSHNNRNKSTIWMLGIFIIIIIIIMIIIDNHKNENNTVIYHPEGRWTGPLDRWPCNRADRALTGLWPGWTKGSLRPLCHSDWFVLSSFCCTMLNVNSTAFYNASWIAFCVVWTCWSTSLLTVCHMSPTEKRTIEDSSSDTDASIHSGVSNVSLQLRSCQWKFPS